eukprot:5732725-Amphidinium_carterae.1
MIAAKGVTLHPASSSESRRSPSNVPAVTQQLNHDSDNSCPSITSSSGSSSESETETSDGLDSDSSSSTDE